MTKDPAKRKIWESNIGRGKADFKANDSEVACSNRFAYGAQWQAKPNKSKVRSNSHIEKKESLYENRNSLHKNKEPLHEN